MLKTQTKQAIEFCKKLKGSEEYKESMLYAKFKASIGIKKCTEISKKY